MIGTITKIIYWKDKDGFYHIQVEYDGNYSEVSLVSVDEFEELKDKYGNIMEEAD
jgi:hypothetical protein